MSHNLPSLKTQQEAMAVAKATQKPGQTKEQTKFIAQGIEKGIVLYKKQQKIKGREEDKRRKKQSKSKQTHITEDLVIETTPRPSSIIKKTPWCLLVLSWAGFITYLLLTHQAISQ